MLKLNVNEKSAIKKNFHILKLFARNYKFIINHIDHQTLRSTLVVLQLSLTPQN